MGINDRKSYIEVFYGEISAINSNRSKGRKNTWKVDKISFMGQKFCLRGRRDSAQYLNG